MAVNPVDFEAYIVVGLDSQPLSIRNLLQININTGVARNVGPMNQKIAGIAFAADGTLYGVSGDGSAIPETVFKISTTDASLTQWQTLGNGDFGETIAFNPVDGLMYHLSGAGAGMVFEKFGLNGAPPVTAIPLSGFSDPTY